MAEPLNNIKICRNGHQQPNADSRFCIYCGTSLDVPPVQPVVSQPPTPVNQPYSGGQGFPQQPNPNINPQPNQYAQQQYAPQQQQYFQQQPVQNVQQPVQNLVLGSSTQPAQCQICGGNGQRLEPHVLVCAQCNWLRPLVPGYGVDCSAFQWAEDGKAMSVLRAIKPLHAVAQSISHKIGRRWVESLFNGVLLSEEQLPEIYAKAVQAARILGMTHMPDIYISGEMMWDCRTYGSDKDAFIVMGTALATNFRSQELLFIFAREMGHCRAGHALWKTVIKFLMGEQGPRKGIMGGGLFAALSPSALLEGALEMPLLAWARQAEITADRAGLLAVGNEEIARRVLLSWSLKSTFLYRQINLDAWLRQQAAADDDMTKLSELTTSATPYITRRLKLMEDFAKSPDLLRWQSIIDQFIQRSQAIQINPNLIPGNQPKPPQASQTPPNNDIKMKCAACGMPLRVPQKVLEGKDQISIRCPNPKCGNLTKLKKKNNSATPENKPVAEMPNKIERNLTYDE